jgi:hypothetical protein
MTGHSSITGIGPEDAHAFDVIPERARGGELDAECPTCHGHGQWNAQIDLASFRSVRTTCDHCEGLGWIETGDDFIPVPDIVMTPAGYAKWVVRLRAAG